MNVLALTIFVTLALALFFVVLFVQTAVTGSSRPEDALLPLEPDRVSPSPVKTKNESRA